MTELETIEGEVVEEMTQALEVHHAEPPVGLFKTEDPVEIVTKATLVATTLAEVLRKQKLTTKIGKSEHVRVEGWTLLGTMLGVFPVCEWTRRLDNGWEARVTAQTLSGAIVGAAEAECLRSESTWKDRDDYALRSMAQTRATSKALRQPLGFVISLAGFDPTPAEEMPHEEVRKENPPPKAPGTWKAIEAALRQYDESTWLAWRDFSKQASLLLFGDGEMTAEQKRELTKLASAATWALVTGHPVDEFPPPSREEMRAAWAEQLDKQELEGPSWRMGPKETEREPREVNA